MFKPNCKSIYVFGAGGHGREVAWLIKHSWGSDFDLHFLVDDPAFLGSDVDGVSIGLIDAVPDNSQACFVAAVGDSMLRRKAAAACFGKGLKPARLAHPSSIVAESAAIGAGSVICAHTVLTTGVRVGEHVHINIACTISHDSCIGDFSTLSPGVHVAGHVSIGRDVFIGIGANIINGRASEPLCIGDGAIIAAGACVTKSVAPGEMVAGVPAIQKK